MVHRRLNAKAMMDRLGIRSRETLRKLVKTGLLPPPVQDFEGGPNYWPESDADAFIEAQIEQRRQRVVEQVAA